MSLTSTLATEIGLRRQLAEANHRLRQTLLEQAQLLVDLARVNQRTVQRYSDELRALEIRANLHESKHRVSRSGSSLGLVGADNFDPETDLGETPSGA